MSSLIVRHKPTLQRQYYQPQAYQAQVEVIQQPNKSLNHPHAKLAYRDVMHVSIRNAVLPGVISLRV